MNMRYSSHGQYMKAQVDELKIEPLDKREANYSLQVKFKRPSVCLNKVLLEHSQVH
jgi:hypothetical protein